jgi:hypothetical protein
MKEDFTCNRTRELLEAYALGALDEDERRAVEAHLASCPECRREADELLETAHALPLALGAASRARLPSSLKARVFQAIEADGTGVPTARPRSPSRTRLALALGAIAVVAVVSAWNAHLTSALAQERSQRERLAQLVGRQETVLEVVDSPQTRRAFLRPAGTDSPAYGKVFTRPDVRDVVAMAARLKQPRPGRAYRLWLTGPDGTHSAGSMLVNAQGFALLVYKADRRGPAYDEARVVLQRKNAATPAGTTVLVWRSGS